MFTFLPYLRRRNGMPPQRNSPASTHALAPTSVGDREAAFWDGHTPTLDDCLAEVALGPDRQTEAMLAAIEPLAGCRVLDFACGAGITSAWLAQRGAMVTGIDVSPSSISRASELADRLGLNVAFTIGELTSSTYAPGTFDAVVGRYALHHVDLGVVAPMLAQVLKDGGRGAFIETMGLNPLLNLARRHLAGRGIVANYGSEDEQPLTLNELRVLRERIGQVELEVPVMSFLRILDRNVLRYRVHSISTAFGRLDDAMLRRGLGGWSYHQLVKVRKRAAL
jgi:SAM-dependent methyltransferase